MPYKDAEKRRAYDRERKRNHHASHAQELNAAKRARREANGEHVRAQDRALYLVHREKRKTATREYYKVNRMQVLAATRAWQEANPKALRKAKLKYRYGLAEGEYDTLLNKQGGCCAICGTTSPGGSGAHFHVDHHHDSGRVRGLLCQRCNTAIGLMRDDAAMLLKAARYLADAVVNKPEGIGASRETRGRVEAGTALRTSPQGCGQRASRFQGARS
jgi:hypothetical protein